MQPRRVTMYWVIDPGASALALRAKAHSKLSRSPARLRDKSYGAAIQSRFDNLSSGSPIRTKLGSVSKRTKNNGTG